MLNVGDSIPEAQAYLGPGQPISMRELIEDGPKLLVFYPFDWSSTCTNEMELLRDAREQFDELGVQPVGISRDSPWTHIAWTQVLDLNFGLLSDFNGDVIRAFGVAMEHRGFRDVARRCAFLIDEDGIIREAWDYMTDVVPDPQAWVEACRTLNVSGRSG